MMAIRESMEKQGNWLFRRRSYIPLLIIPLCIGALCSPRILDNIIGGRISNYWEFFSISISFLGLGIRCLTVGYVPRGTSGRNIKAQLAESLNTTGMYSVARNPIYLGNFIIILGITLFTQVWWFALAVWILFSVYYERIIFAEEEFLRKKFGALFMEWADKTPAFFPKLKNWKSPNLKFSLRTVIKREFSTFFAIASAFFFLKLGANLLVDKRLEVHSSWEIFYIISVAVYLTCVVLKRNTELLNSPHR